MIVEINEAPSMPWATGFSETGGLGECLIHVKPVIVSGKLYESLNIALGNGMGELRRITHLDTVEPAHGFFLRNAPYGDVDLQPF